MAYASTIISGVASLGVLVGLISGIFFLVLFGLRRVSRVREALQEEELRRQKRYLLGDPYLLGTRSSNLADIRKEENGFENSFCRNTLEKNSDKNFHSDVKATGIWADGETERKTSEKENAVTTDTVQVRELIEKLVENIIGGPLDGITVGKLSTHTAYLAMFTKYHSLLCQELARLGFALHLTAVHKNAFLQKDELDSSNATHSNLQRLIKRIVSEAMALPNIQEILNRPKLAKTEVDDDFNDKSYEDILATAILNKVIENFQNNNVNKTVHGKKKTRRKAGKLMRSEDDDDLVSNSDWSDSTRSDQLSLTIEEHIEEVTTAFEVSDDERFDQSEFETKVRRVPFPESGRTVRDGSDEENSDGEEHSSATELITSTNSWEENWLFQRKRLRSTPNAHHPVPVPMLVPNPSEDFRALVGGVDADDLSDMSDCSDSVLEDLIMTEGDQNQTNHGSQHHDDGEIHGKEDEDKIEDQKKMNGDLNKESEKSNDADPKLVEKNGNESNGVRDVIEECDVEGVSDDTKNSSPELLSQKDREFSVEDFDWRQQLDSSVTQTPPKGENLEPTIDGNDQSVRCRIAEREKEKWKNPVFLPDNPYSLESITRREKENKNKYFRIEPYTKDSIDFPDDTALDDFARKKYESMRFTRDYYINSSKYPSGMSSSLSLNQLSTGRGGEEGNEHDFSAQNKRLSLSSYEVSIEMQRNEEEQKSRSIGSTYQVSLPNVKELVKQFATDDSSSHSLSKLDFESKQKKISKHFDNREPERNSSSVPVSQIVLNLKLARDPPSRKNITTPRGHISKTLIHKKNNNKSQIKNQTIVLKTETKSERRKDDPDAVRFNGKQVHSLTARSISREFREGLKSNSYQKGIVKTDKSHSGSETDQGDIVCYGGDSSPTHSVDLKNMRKFWEGLIMANSQK